MTTPKKETKSLSTSTVTKLPKATAELEMTIPWDEIKDTYQKIFNSVVSSAEISGFRKGKAPKKMVEERVDKTKIYEEVAKEIVPKAYAEGVKTHSLSPVASPKVELVEASEGKPWKLKATIALKPGINLKNYKEKIKELKKTKANKIWLPGQEKKADAKEEDKKPTLDELMNVLTAEVEVELSDLLITEEANRLLSGLLDQTQKLGMTVEGYLQAKGLTSEQLRADYATQARRNLTVEFALSEIADKENISVTNEDIEQLIAKGTSDEEKTKLRSQSYYLAHLLRQQKTLDFLYNL